MVSMQAHVAGAEPPSSCVVRVLRASLSFVVTIDIAHSAGMLEIDIMALCSFMLDVVFS